MTQIGMCKRIGDVIFFDFINDIAKIFVSNNSIFRIYLFTAVGIDEGIQLDPKNKGRQKLLWGKFPSSGVHDVLIGFC